MGRWQSSCRRGSVFGCRVLVTGGGGCRVVRGFWQEKENWRERKTGGAKESREGEDIGELREILGEAS